MKRVTLARNREVVHGTVQITSTWTGCRINLTQRALEEDPRETHLPVSCGKCLRTVGLGAQLTVVSAKRAAA